MKPLTKTGINSKLGNVKFIQEDSKGKAMPVELAIESFPLSALPFEVKCGHEIVFGQ